MRVYIAFLIGLLFANGAYSQPQVAANNTAIASLDVQLIGQLNTLQFSNSGGGVYSTGKAKPQEVQLVGFVVEGNEVGLMQVISDSKVGFYYPLELTLKALDLRGRLLGGGVDITTPAGQVYIDRSELVFYGGTAYVTGTALVNQLKLDITFNESSYAIEVALPWWENSEEGDNRRVYNPDKVDYEPSNFSLRHLQARYFYNSDDTYQDDAAEYTVGGGAYGGAWAFRALDDLEGDIRPDEYFWVKQFDYQQLLVGKSNTGVHPLVPAIELSGGAYIYSSERFNDRLGADITRNNFARQSGSAVRDIIGDADAGDIAELVINGRVTARNRVRLDGVYEFLNIELSSRGYNDVQVRLFNRSSLTLKDTHDYSVSSRSVIESVGEYKLYVAGGKRGNILDDTDADNPDAGIVSFRYGLFDDFTLEAGVQDSGIRKNTLLGLNTSFANNWFGSIAASTNDISGEGYQAELSGDGDGWQFNLLTNEYMANYSSEDSERSWNRRAALRYVLDDSWTVGFTGMDYQDSVDSERFLLPSLWYNLPSVFAVSFVPNNEASYRVDGSIFAFDKSRIIFNYENDFYRAEWIYNYSSDYDIYAESTYLEDFSVRYETGVRWFGGQNSDDEFRAGIVGTAAGNYGFNIDWRKKVLPGVSSFLVLRDEPKGTERSDIDVGLALRWELSLDFSLLQGKIVPASRQLGTRSSVGSISGQLLLDDKPLSAEHNIDKISVLVDGYPRDVEVTGSYFIIDNVRPGLAEIRLDGEHLPIQFTPKNDKYIVEVERGAVTYMPLNLTEEYSVAGRAITATGTRLVAQKVSAFDEFGGRIAQVLTDRFGLYRVNAIAPGTYQFVFEVNDDAGNQRKVSREVIVTNEFLFGQDIVVGDQNEFVEPVSQAAAVMPIVTVINEKFEAVDTSSAVVESVSTANETATSYGSEFNVTHIPVDGCSSGDSVWFIQLASYTDLSVARRKLAEYSIDNSFIDFYDRKETGMRQYRIAVGPFTESENDLAARAKRYESITGANSWTRYRACDDVRRHPPVNGNQDSDVDADELAAAVVVNEPIETIDLTPVVATILPAKPNENERKVAHIALDSCPSGSSASFIQLITYSDLANAQNKLSEYSIDNSFIDFYDREIGNTVKRQYRIAVGPFTESSQNLADRAKRYENITGAKSWTRTRACDDLRRHP
jgi:hypothetical protein